MPASSLADAPPVTLPPVRRVLLVMALTCSVVAGTGVVAPMAAMAEGSGNGSTTLPPATPGPPPADDAAAAPPTPPLAPPGADEAGRQRAAAELRTAKADLKAAAATHARLTKALAAIERKQFDTQARMATLTEAERTAAEELAAARLKLRKMAVAGYVRGGDSQPVDYLLRATDPADLERRRALVASATRARSDNLHDYEVAQAAASDELQRAVAELEGAARNVERAKAELNDAAVAVMQRQAEVDHRSQLLDLVTAAAPVGASDIPRLFLDAYRQAAAGANKRAPQCRVQWQAVAGIGRIESNHGRYRGAQLALNGDVYPRIVGIPLDGTRTALVKDTDQGALDGDTVFDRAVGPMQFIPSTWKRIDTDGNGDGVRDPNNAYDAALGTANYLCRAVPAGGLDTDDALRIAFFSYNHSDAYVEAALTGTHLFQSMTDL
ncbi:MAG: hypothetical protein QOF60_1221 [Actinomycetota bacterium]|jgi:membrane-bound lytic murein transglycosylase B|nr:hypothetical protein [Actinomycetota bacterium]